MAKFIFSRKLRLLTTDDFSFVFQKPQRANTLQITVLARLNYLKNPRIGFIISKKNVRFAHERNRIKRLARESFRLQQHELPHMDFVMIAKKGIVSFDNNTLLEELKTIWCHYCLLIHESS